MRVKSIWLCLSLISVPLVFAQEKAQTVPRMVKYNGAVRDRAGDPIKGVVGITFNVYKEEHGGTPVWHEIQNVELDANGSYSVMLGAALPLPGEIFTANEARWLGVEPVGQAEQPRVLLLSVPYALKAADSETLAGRPASAYMLAAPEPEGARAASAKDTPKSAEASHKSTDTLPATVGGSGTTNFVPLWTSSTNLGNSVMFQSGSGSTAKIGINSTAPANTLQVVAPNQLGVLIQGPITGTGAGLDMQTTGTGGKEWEILATGNTSAQGVGKLNIRDLSTAKDVFTIAPGGLIGIDTTKPASPLDVEANSTTTAATVNNTGTGPGLTASTSSTAAGVAAVVGKSTTTASSSANGVLGTNSSPSLAAAGVRGEIDASTGAGKGVLGITFGSGTLGAGVQGQSNSGLTYGVQGITLSSSNLAAGVNAVADAATGQNYGLQATNFSDTNGAVGVFGAESGVNHNGKTFGAFFAAVSSLGTGTYSQSEGESGTAFGILSCCPVGVWGDTASNLPGAAGLVGTADDGRAIYLQNNSPSGVPTAFALNSVSNQFFPVLVAQGNFGSCEIDTNGNLSCTGSKSAVVPVDSGRRQVALYAVEAPQNWFEDFGSGRLANGAATVKLESVFAQTVNAGTEYHVFLTAEGDCRGLYVDLKTASGFEVHELGGGQSSVPFSYRIVALRRGYELVRLRDMTEDMNRVEAARLKPSSGSPVAMPPMPQRQALNAAITPVVNTK
jgi:hypothetical protein